MHQDWLNAILGGVIIGVSVSLMLLLNGRVTGISGIINGAMTTVKGERAWKILFIVGLFLGGVVLKVLKPNVFTGALPTDDWTTVVAGLLVGFGTIMGSGCTSGHGVCGISRLSLRSMFATLVFIASGIVAVFFFRKFGIIV